MRRQVWAGAIVLALIGAKQGLAADYCCEVSGDRLCARFAPVGGWHPYDGGLIHWWPRHCFPDCGAPDDYCRKPLPKVCWPAYPAYYKWGSPPTCPPKDACLPVNGKAH